MGACRSWSFFVFSWECPGVLERSWVNGESWEKRELMSKLERRQRGMGALHVYVRSIYIHIGIYPPFLGRQWDANHHAASDDTKFAF